MESEHTPAEGSGENTAQSEISMDLMEAAAIVEFGEETEQLERENKDLDTLKTNETALVDKLAPVLSEEIVVERPAEEPATVTRKRKLPDEILSHVHCLAQLKEQRRGYEQQLEQLRTANAQKDNIMTLLQREIGIQEKEKLSARKEMELANKEKEATVIKFAMKEKLLIDAKKEKETLEKQLAEARKEVKNVSTRFQAVNEEKSRITYIIDEKCNEVRKYQRECEKLKADLGHLESRLKYHVNKLSIETEAKLSLERKLEEERNAPNKLEEKANDKLRLEYDASTILLKHEITSKTEALERLSKEQQQQNEANKELQQQLLEIQTKYGQLEEDLRQLREQHHTVEAAYSDELLNSSKLRGQLEELELLRTQHNINAEKLTQELRRVEQLESTLLDNAADLAQLHEKQHELLSINQEMTELNVQLQNDNCLAKSKALGLEEDNKLLKQEKLRFDQKYSELEQQLRAEASQKNEERQMLAKHLSEKTKLYELTKSKLDNVQGDFEATQHKHSTVVRELQRELLKARGGGGAGAVLSRRSSDSSESESVINNSQVPNPQAELQSVPSQKLLVERILRLQQATARQAERIEFLEQHTAALVAEVQQKSKVIQHYASLMLRDQTPGRNKLSIK